MRMNRILTVGLTALAAMSVAWAQFEGPAPLAWRWVQPTSVPPSGTPLVDGDSVYVAVGQRIYALDRETGNRRWQFPTVEPIEGFFRSAPIKFGNLVVAASDNKSIFAVNAATGERAWQHVTQVPILGEPVAINDKLIAFAQSDNTIMVLNGETGQPFWERAYRIQDNIVGRIAGYQGNILVLNQINQILSIDATTQRLNWRRQFTALGPDSRPVVFGDMVYVNSNTFVVALSALSGTARWNADAGDFINYAPAVSAAGVAVGTRDGKAVLFDLQNGRRLLRNPVELGSFPITAPSFIGNVVVFPTSNGSLNLIDSKTGNLIWNYQIKPFNVQQAQGDASGGGALGGGDLPGGGGAGGRGGGGQPGGGTTGTTTQRVISIPAAGAPVLAGTTLLVLARDGSLLAFDRVSGVDLTPPTVSMTWPRPGDQVSSLELDLFFQIDDEASGINTSTLKVEVDGKALDYKFGRDGVLSLRFSPASKNGTLTDGRKTFIITVSDWMGNVSTQQIALTIDNALPRTRPTAPPNQGGGGPGFGGGGRGDGS